MTDRARVVVTGLGLATSLGVDVEPVWNAILDGRCGIGHLRQYDSHAFPVNIASEVDVERIVASDHDRGLVRANRALAFANWAASKAWSDSGMNGSADRARIGVCVGAGGFPAIETQIRGRALDVAAPAARWSVESLYELLREHRELTTQYRLSSISAFLSQRFQLDGPSLTIQGACTSGTQATGEAFHMIRSGLADVMLAGAADSMVSAFCLAGFWLLGALSTHADPETSSRPFDLTRNGFVIGEGAGMVVLESLPHALARGARIYAEVIGYGSSSDGYRFTDVHPEGRGAAAAMRNCLEDAGIAPHDVDAINAHGTATPQNDRIETIAIKSAFGAHAERVAISSTKSHLGHLICAAGAVETVLTCLTVRDDVVPATINLRKRDPECDLDFVPVEARRMRVRTALSNSFGFGGQNGSIAIRKFEGETWPRASARRDIQHRDGLKPVATFHKAVLTGIGVVSPLASNAREHWTRYREGASGITIRDANSTIAPFGAPAYDESMPQTVRNRMLRKLLQKTATMAVVAAGEATRDAGLDGDADTLARMGLYIASVSFDSPQSNFAPALEVSIDAAGQWDPTKFATRGIPRIDPLLIVKSLPNAGLCGIAIEHGVLGPNLNISSGSCGGAQALVRAARAIERGETDVVMAGAYDSVLGPEHLAAEVLDGMTVAPGEGAVVWILESEERARQRGARIYARIAASHESFASLHDAARLALRASGRAPRHVFGDLLDAAEPSIAHEVVGDDARIEGACDAIGFTGAASGMFSATHAALAIRDGEIPDALVWRSDRGVRNVAIVLAAP
ncbi:MAG TPA: beta-ketoacyl-[acyl-carrier-protein] synthase family protein [Thermoanaerobaculia bacterium]|nr:beta-ketoacyl-[acyl-carrier-protein] synthase family protein [Thermoanaerobaculia bacterium]